MDWRARMGGLARRLLVACAVLALAFFAGVGVWTVASRAGMESPEAPSSESEASPSQETSGIAPSAGASTTPTSWDEAESPNYYRVVGPASVGSKPAVGSIVYGELDDLGRATGAVGLLTYDTMQAGRAREREDVSALEPSGWGHNAEVDIAMPDGTVYHGLLFNRSHLIAKSLGGNEELRNLICAARTQNVGANLNGSEGGMAYTEGLARSWLEAHPTGSLYFAATPLYQGDELVARSVMVDLLSDDGSLDQRVEVYNAARGFAIDYATGTFTVTEDAASAAAQIRAGLGIVEQDASSAATTERTINAPSSSESEERLVIVTGSGKAYHHDESCRGLANARSMSWVTVSEAEAMGRHPCGICGG